MKPIAVGDMESYFALREAAGISAAAEYFAARPETNFFHDRALFEAGFYRAFDLCNPPATGDTVRETLEEPSV